LAWEATWFHTKTLLTGEDPKVAKLTFIELATAVFVDLVKQGFPSSIFLGFLSFLLSFLCILVPILFLVLVFLVLVFLVIFFA